MSRRLCSTLLSLVLVGTPGVVFLSSPSAVHAQQRTKRLILKDGSYQPAVKYEVQGNRVHFLSAERYEWEDIPTSLIDWDATHKWEADLSAGKLVTKLEETPEEKAEREKEEANSPEIAPGMRLPGTGGVFLFDQYQGKPQISQVEQNSSEVKKNVAGNMVRSTINPLAGQKQAFELAGTHARIQSHVPRPALYVSIDEGGTNDVPLNDRFRIVRAEIKKESRVVGNLKIAFYGKVSQQGNFIPVQTEKLGVGQWVKISPGKDLPPGEYALVEMLGKQEMNLNVWDFGVNPKAPANPGSWESVRSPAEASNQNAAPQTPAAPKR